MKSQLATQSSSVPWRPGAPAPLAYRPVRCTDQSALAAFYEGLSPRSRSLRFHGMGHLSTPELTRFADADGRTSAGFVALADHMIIGHCVLVPAEKTGIMEIAVAVADDFQHQRVGSALCKLAADWACQHNVRQLLVPVLWGNVPMERLARHLGRASCLGGAGVETFTVTLRHPRQKPAALARHP